jgi:hypothetical protein
MRTSPEPRLVRCCSLLPRVRTRIMRLSSQSAQLVRPGHILSVEVSSRRLQTSKDPSSFRSCIDCRFEETNSGAFTVEAQMPTTGDVGAAEDYKKDQAASFAPLFGSWMPNAYRTRNNIQPSCKCHPTQAGQPSSSQDLGMENTARCGVVATALNLY